ncbi:hypothetical protein [Lysinibacillus sp. fls2-241-R2A-57]|uniref:hypothetical protein n=1 Tax=Lysinibacillus sp. fls2-241-R2A-57 TaxID=3040292 RepID=UPI00255619E5|nr:hypothetical protein [Lysinibacillus sp. fls2-241-R2A-57]
MRDFLKEIIKEVKRQLTNEQPSIENILDGKLFDWFIPIFDFLLFPEVYLFLASTLMWKMIFSLLLVGMIIIFVLLIEKVIEKKTSKEKVEVLDKKLAWFILAPILFYGVKGLAYGYLLFKPMV